MAALGKNEVTSSLKLHTGAKVNLIFEYDISAMNIKPHINQKSVQLKAYNGVIKVKNQKVIK